MLCCIEDLLVPCSIPFSLVCICVCCGQHLRSLCMSLQGMILVQGQDALKQIQSQWQSQKQWAFALDVVTGHMAGNVSLQLPSLPGTDIGRRLCVRHCVYAYHTTLFACEKTLRHCCVFDCQVLMMVHKCVLPNVGHLLQQRCHILYLCKICCDCSAGPVLGAEYAVNDNTKLTLLCL